MIEILKTNNMKKIILSAVAVLFVSVVAQAQFKVGVNGGIPIGQVNDNYSFILSGDLGYFFELSEEFAAGPIANYLHAFGDEVGGMEINDLQLIPVGGGFRWSPVDALAVGVDLAYAFSVSEDTDLDDGDFYYAPKLVYNFSDNMGVVAAYRSVVDLDEKGSRDFVSLGLEFTID